MSDMEIYIDSIATMQINNLNDYISLMRAEVQRKTGATDREHYMQTLEASRITENDYFTRLLSDDISAIARDLKENHQHDLETGDNYSPLSHAYDIIKEYNSAKSENEKLLLQYSQIFQINFHKMDPYEFDYFTRLLNKYSRLPTVSKKTVKKTRK